MFPNVRLMIVAVVASVFVLSCGFGVFAALRVNHEPLARLPSVTAPVQLAADNPAPTSVTIAPGAAFGSHLQLSSPPKTDDGPESTASIRPVAQPPVALAQAPTDDGVSVTSAPLSEREANSATQQVGLPAAPDPAPDAAATVAQPAVTANDPPQDVAAPVVQPAAVASPAQNNAAAVTQPAMTANDPPQDSAAPAAQPTVAASPAQNNAAAVTQPSMIANNPPPQDSVTTVAPSGEAASDPAPDSAAAVAQPTAAASSPAPDSAAAVALPMEAASDPAPDSAALAAEPAKTVSDAAQDNTASVAAAPAGDQVQPIEKRQQSKPEKAVAPVVERKPVGRAALRFARKIVRKAAPVRPQIVRRAVPVRPRFAVETYRVRKPRLRIRTHAVALSYSADPSTVFLTPNFQSAPPFAFATAPVKARRTARRAAVKNTAVGGPFVAPAQQLNAARD